MLVKIVFFLILTFSSVSPVTILVHGTIAPHRHVIRKIVEWWLPGGGFFESLTEQASRRGDIVVPFIWSGGLRAIDREQAAIVLARIITSYPVSEHITLVGHSYGGDVILKALQKIYEPFKKIAFDIAPLTVESYLEQCFASQAGQRQHSVASAFSLLPKPRPSGFDLVPTPRAIIFLDTPSDPCRIQPVQQGKRRFLVDEIYLLATPIDEIEYYPQTELVGQIFNIYSKGDYVQQLAGQRQFISRPKIANIELFVREKDSLKFAMLSHSELHSPTIGRHLFSLAQYIASPDVKGNWQASGLNIILALHWDKGPSFCS